jgi:hypothetical protein
MSNTDHTKNPGAKASAREGLAVPASYLTPAVVHIYIVKSLTVVSVIEERYNLRKK